jgi:hypothetical protein
VTKDWRDTAIYGAIGALTAVTPFLDTAPRWCQAVVATLAGALVAVKAKMSKGEPE